MIELVSSDGEMDLPKQAANFYCLKAYTDAARILENIKFEKHSWRSLAILGKCYSKLLTCNSTAGFYEFSLDLSSVSCIEAFKRISVIDLELTPKSNANNLFHGSAKIGVYSVELMELLVIFEADSSIDLQYYFAQRLQIIKSSLLNSFTLLSLCIEHNEFAYAFISNEFTRLILRNNYWFRQSFSLAKQITHDDIESIQDAFIVLAKNTINYYHFVAECIPCFIEADKVLPGEIAFVCFTQTSGNLTKDNCYSFHYQLLTYFFPKRKIISVDFIGSPKLLRLKNIYSTMSLPFMIDTSYMLKDFFRSTLSCSQCLEIYDIVYIKRGENEGRKLLNDDILCNIIRKSSKNALIMNTAEESWIQQIEKLRNASIVISSHGAQITSSVFCTNLSMIIEIWPKTIATPKALCESFCDEYFWIESIFSTSLHDPNHHSDHYLSIENINQINTLISRTLS